ncbi:hypothetical protein LRS06_23660 [Hymenobacter sp. J193]|nr:hypothetical protein [Hymenobacter sp. J193]MCR5890727.1 hypothetical protein [Hymenobacter sp. J193]
MLVAQGLEGKGEVAHLVRRLGVQLRGKLFDEHGLALFPHPPQQFGHALAGQLRQHLEVGPPQALLRGALNNVRHGRVDDLKHVVRAAHHPNAGGGLRKDVREQLPLDFALPAGEHLLGDLEGKDADARYLLVFAVGLVGKVEVQRAGGSPFTGTGAKGASAPK